VQRARAFTSQLLLLYTQIICIRRAKQMDTFLQLFCSNCELNKQNRALGSVGIDHKMLRSGSGKSVAQGPLPLCITIWAALLCWKSSRVATTRFFIFFCPTSRFRKPYLLIVHICGFIALNCRCVCSVDMPTRVAPRRRKNLRNYTRTYAQTIFYWLVGFSARTLEFN
jgi:hypothetical protein